MTREPLVSKMFNHFGETTFRPGSFKFNYGGELYDIHSIKEDSMAYGQYDWTLKVRDSTQFAITKVEKTGGLYQTCCVIYLAELR